MTEISVTSYAAFKYVFLCSSSLPAGGAVIFALSLICLVLKSTIISREMSNWPNLKSDC